MSICKELDCPNASLARGLCSMHYYRYKRNGTIEDHPPIPENTDHSLSTINDTERTAVCQVCGPVGIVSNGTHPRSGKKRWTCKVHSSNRIKKAPVNRKYSYEGGEIDKLAAHAERLRLESEGNVCQVCGVRPDTKRLALDHCHTTGKVRGLLCSACNIGLGQFKDNPELLQAAIDYLNR